MTTNKYTQLTVSVTLLGFLLTGCASSGLIADKSYMKTMVGAGLGTLAGGIIAYNASGGKKGSKKRANAALGALGGGLLGAGAGYALDVQANKIANALGTGVDNDPLSEIDPNKDLIVSKHDQYVKIMFRDPKMFASGSSNLNTYTRTNIQKVGKLLHQYPKTLVVVSGHTDNVGKVSVNQALSEKRAKSVADTLSNSGIKNEQFLEGCSFNRPVIKNNTASNRALNRRVEVYLYNDPKSITSTCK